MYKKTITYTDYDGVERTEDFYFNLSKAELLDMELLTPGGLSGRIEQIINAKNQVELIGLFKEFIQKAYGVKSPDGRRFVKSAENLEDFMSTEAYSELYMELATDTDKALEFVNGLMPKLSPEEQAKVDAEVSERISVLNTESK